MIQEIVDRLNDLLELDPKALRHLIDHRVPCNRYLAEHPDAQCGMDGGTPVIGILGVLNGIAGSVGGYGRIAVDIDENGDLIRFVRTAFTVGDV